MSQEELERETQWLREQVSIIEQEAIEFHEMDEGEEKERERQRLREKISSIEQELQQGLPGLSEDEEKAKSRPAMQKPRFPKLRKP